MIQPGHFFARNPVLSSRLLILVLVAVLLPGLISARASGTKHPTIFTSLYNRLQNDGFDARVLQKYYAVPRVTFEQESISRFFRHTESQLNYDQFLDRSSIRKARKYMDKQDAWLNKAEERFQVSPEIITAILLVETRLGTFVGRDYALNILSSMAALADPKVREMFWENMQSSTTMTRQAFEAKAARKSLWAYTELKAFLTYSNREALPDPAAIKSSYAGAIGIPQFMPSNILILGVDGDENGRVDLFTHADAIFSVANYLHRYGWEPGLSPQAAYRVLFYYNHSKYYVNTLLQIAEKLKDDA